MFPEETLKGFDEAIKLNTDYIEMDVVSTKDFELITRHDLTLNSTTNVADIEEFRNRTSTKMGVTDYFSIDFELREIKKMRARQSFSFRDQSHNDKYEIPTLDEVLKLVKERRKKRYPTGAYIETKHPEFHRAHGRPLEEKLVTAIKENGLLHDSGAIFLQSFSMASLQLLHELLKKEGASVPLVWLLECDTPLPTLAQLKEFKKIGTAIGPSKSMLIEMDTHPPECHRPRSLTCDQVAPGQTCSGRVQYYPGGWKPIPGEIIELARNASLDIHAYTFRNEVLQSFDSASPGFTPELEFFTKKKFGIKIQGLFVDCPKTAVRVYGGAKKLPGFGLESYWMVLIFFGVNMCIWLWVYAVSFYRRFVTPHIPQKQTIGIYYRYYREHPNEIGGDIAEICLSLPCWKVLRWLWSKIPPASTNSKSDGYHGVKSKSVEMGVEDL